MSEIEIQTAETSETLEKRGRDWQELCAKLDDYKKKAKNCDEWKRKYDELLITLKEEKIRHLKEVYNARASKLSPDVLATMNPDTTTKAKPQELYEPNRVAAPQRVSLRAISRNTTADPSDTYLVPQFQEIFDKVAEATMQEIHRAPDRSLGRIVPSLRAGQSPVRRESLTDPTEPAGPVPSETKMRSGVFDIRKDLNTRRTCVQVGAEHPRACLNGMSWNPAFIHQPVPTGRHLIIGDSLVREMTRIFVVGQTNAIAFGGASVARVIKMMELQNDDRVVRLILMIGTNDVSRNPVTREEKWEPLVRLSRV